MKRPLFVCLFSALFCAVSVYAQNKLLLFPQRITGFMERATGFSARHFSQLHQPILSLSDPPYKVAGGIQEAWVRQYGSGLLPSNDVATDVAVDSEANVYVTGYSQNHPYGTDYCTIKYDAAGNRQWTARYNGDGNADDYATALFVDNSGNVYVTGASRGANRRLEYATIKYNHAGVQQWDTRYSSSLINWATAYDITVDGWGNVYVTGSALNSYGYVTIKYNAEGLQQWIARYDIPGEGNDVANAIAVDSFGNIYVTGRNNDHYATVKYDSAGMELWTAVSVSGIATALAVDDSGNVYITGAESVPTLGGTYCVTIKYNNSGEEQWLARYKGREEDLENWQWGRAIAVDNSGNVYVAGEGGYFYDTYSEPPVDRDVDYLTIKYNAAGTEQWISHYGPEYSWCQAIDIALDINGNIYVTGGTRSPDTLSDYVTIKYDVSGVQQWVARFNGVANAADCATALAVDKPGNVYVTGWSIGSDKDKDFVTVKYNSEGAELWVANESSPGSSYDLATALTVDGSGNVYVTGSSAGRETSGDFATVKYNNAGVQEWMRRYSSPGKYDDHPVALAIDGAGNVYVAGWRYEEYSGDPNYSYITVKYNNAGVQEWVARYDGSPYFYDRASALAVDDSGNVYVTGHSLGSSRQVEYVTIKYNSAGNQEWVARYNGPANSWDYPSALTVDDSGNVYVTGSSQKIYGFYDYATIKYNCVGAQQWIARSNGHGGDYASALVVDGSGNIYVTGSRWGSRSSVYWTAVADYLTIKYNSAGEEQWSAVYQGVANSHNGAGALALDSLGNVYVTGSSRGEGYSYYATIKYIQTATSVKENAAQSPVTYYLSQNYPNPFNPSTTIRYALAKTGHVTLKIFDLLGKEVATLVDEIKGAGEYEVRWSPIDLAGGIYIYRIQIDEFVQTKKLILLP